VEELTPPSPRAAGADGPSGPSGQRRSSPHSTSEVSAATAAAGTLPPRAVDLDAAARAIEAFLRALGHAPEANAELARTGRNVATAFHEELLAGHRVDPAQVLAETIPTSSSDLVLVRDIDVTCICPHHLLPASGVVHVGYVPNGKLVGLGALARLARCYAQRLILQETLSEQIAEALTDFLGAAAAGCVTELSPACLTCRGERPARARVITLALRGQMQTDPALRAEFLSLARASTEARP
jgi:GTP cyclohydrolase IA